VRQLGDPATGRHTLHEFKTHFLRVRNHFIKVMHRHSKPDLVDEHSLERPDGYEPVRADD
jgi:hypothetical protein